MPEYPDTPPEAAGRKEAHAVVDFLWDRVHISIGAAVLIFISFCFTAAVWKIDHNANAASHKVDVGICKVVAGANKGTSAQRTRILTAAARDDKQAKAEEQIASIWKYARRKQPRHTPKSQRQLVNKLIHAQEALAHEDRAAAKDLRKQAKAVAPIEISGC